MKLALLGMSGVAGMIALQADPALDPAVAALRDEFMKTLPMIAGAKQQMEAIVGKSIGPETLVLCLFIVFCGRGVVAIANSMVEEFRLSRKERRDVAKEEREALREERRLRLVHMPQAASQATLEPAGDQKTGT